MAGQGAVARGWVYFSEVKTIPVEDLQTVGMRLGVGQRARVLGARLCGWRRVGAPRPARRSPGHRVSGHALGGEAAGFPSS
jgi:hypothetical protein